MPTISLSDAAQDLLRRRLAGEWVEVSDQTRQLYRELVEAVVRQKVRIHQPRIERDLSSVRDGAAFSMD